MPDQYFSQEKIDSYLSSFDARKLTSREIDVYKKAKDISVTCGWSIPTDILYKGKILDFHLMFTEYSSIPNVYVQHEDFIPLNFPHVENFGKLCIWSENVVADLKNLDYLQELLTDAVKLLNKVINGQITKDFESEFESYWLFNANNLQNKDLAKLNLCKNFSREIAFYPLSNSRYLFCENVDEMQYTLEYLNQKTITEKAKIASLKAKKTCLINMPRTIHPNEYPKTIYELLQLIEKDFPHNYTDIRELIAKAISNPTISQPQILLCFDTVNGRALVGLRLAHGILHRNRSNSYLDGYRSSLPIDVLFSRMGQIKFFGRLINRIDSSWMIGRDKNKELTNIRKHKVAVVGCGSVGSSVAMLLIKSGIEDLILIDGDILSTANLSRHELDQRYIGVNKAIAMKYYLESIFPFAKIKSFSQNFNNQDEIVHSFQNVDLIISCTSNWYAEQQLLNLQTDFQCPIIFGSVEPHAMAGHAIINLPETNAYNSLYNLSGSEIGSLKNTVCLWDNDTLEKIPACAGEFQPYGAIELGFITSMIAKKALDIIKNSAELSTHSIWLGDTNQLNELNGSWNPNIGVDMDTIAQGSKVLEFTYDSNNSIWNII